MRYILNDEGYIYNVSFGAEIQCDLGTCTEYKGKVPDGYSSIEEWHDEEIDKLNAWKIVDGNLVFDENRCYKLQIKYEQELEENSHITRKELGMMSSEETAIYSDLFPSKSSNTDYIASADGTDNLSTEEVTLTVSKDTTNFIELDFIGNNFLPNTAFSSSSNGINYKQNADKTIEITGTATDISTLSLAGTDTSVRNILTFKANEKYMLFGLNEYVNLEFYHYEGSDRTLIGTYNDGIISFDEDVNITQVVLTIENGTTINTTISPMLKLVKSNYPALPLTKYKGNLFDKNAVEIGKSWHGGTNANRASFTLEYEQNKDYSIFLDEFENISSVAIVEAKEIVGSGAIYTKVFTEKFNFTHCMSSNAKYLCIQIETTTTFTQEQLNNIKIQLERGSITTEYKEYNGRDGQYYIDGVSMQSEVPSPDYPSPIINLYKAGTYNTVAENKLFTITLDDDLRSTPSAADRLWLDINNNVCDIEKKIVNILLNGTESMLVGQYGTNAYKITPPLMPKNNRSNCEIITSAFLGISHADRANYTSNFVYVDGADLYFRNTDFSTIEEFKNWLSENNVEAQYEVGIELAKTTKETTSIEYQYEEYKNNTTLIDLGDNTFTSKDKVVIKENQIILVKNEKNEIILGNARMPKTYLPFTNAYCHQMVYVNFKYRDPRNIDITKITLEGLLSITNIETEYNFTLDDVNKVLKHINNEETLTDEELEKYDINADGIVDRLDFLAIQRIYYEYIPNIIKGTLEINSTQSQRTIVLRDEEGKIQTSIGLNGMTTPNLSCEKLTLNGVEQPIIKTGSVLPDEVTEGMIFLLYEADT